MTSPSGCWTRSSGGPTRSGKAVPATRSSRQPEPESASPPATRARQAAWRHERNLDTFQVPDIQVRLCRYARRLLLAPKPTGKIDPTETLATTAESGSTGRKVGLRDDEPGAYRWLHCQGRTTNEVDLHRGSDNRPRTFRY